METLKLNPQFVKDSTGQNLGVFLPISDFEKLLDELEDYEDTKAFEEAESRKDSEFIPFEQAIEEIRKERNNIKK